MKNNDPSLPARGKDTSRGHIIPLSAESNTYLHNYESKINVEKILLVNCWLSADSQAIFQGFEDGEHGMTFYTSQSSWMMELLKQPRVPVVLGPVSIMQHTKTL